MESTERKTLESWDIEGAREIIRGGMEDPEAAYRIIDLLAEREGKPLTERDARRISEAIGTPCRIVKVAGMTYFSAEPVGNSGLLIDWKTVSVMIPSRETLIDRNPSYTTAAEERNAAREKLLANTPEADGLLSDALRLMMSYRSARAGLGKMLAYGGPLNVARYDLLEAGGVDYRQIP